ncbi:MAG: PTS galactosamine transporter subunit IIC [Peptostreptococcaceae bacterium]
MDFNVTLVQGLLIALVAIIAGLDLWLETFFIFRPIIVAPVVGLILGDLRLGIICGGFTELVFASLTPAGGVQPPNPPIAAIMTVVLAKTTNAEPASAVAMSLPFSILMQYIVLGFYSTFTVFVGKFNKYSEKADVDSFKRLSLMIMVIVSLTYGLVAFLCTYGAQSQISALVEAMPAWLIHGFEVAGGILPAIGFAILLKNLFQLKYLPYLLVGFLIVSFIEVPNLLPVAMVGLVFALLSFFRNDTVVVSSSNNNVEEEFEDGI